MNAPASEVRTVRRALLGAALVVLVAGCRVEVTTETETSTAVPENHAMPAATADFYSLQTRTLAGDNADLSDYQGQVSLVVNVASECGLTPQYTGLQALHAELSDAGFTVLGFPSNDFNGQEPGSPEQIQQFCSTEYAVTFPLFEKVQTKAGDGQSPVYAQLASMTGELPSWNFSKYVVSKDGSRVTFFGPKTPPDDPALRAAIEAELAR
jgi:glutathione peroxidase